MHDVIVIGGGQAGLAAGYYLRRTDLDYVILDDQDRPGGAWLHTWPSLRLFSPSRWSSLPGWLMPGGEHRFPMRDDVIDYLTRYQDRYELPVQRSVRVTGVRAAGDALCVDRAEGQPLHARAVISATGTWSKPKRPRYPGRDDFEGESIHSADYRTAEPYRGRRVLVVGGGNSGAQILAEVSKVAEDARWATEVPPRFLPDDIDGQVLFERATERYRAMAEGKKISSSPGLVHRIDPPPSLGDIVMVPEVKEARERGVLESLGPMTHFTATGAVWPDGTERPFDVVIWCTGYGSALDHLEPLDVLDSRGQVKVNGTRSVREPRLWLLGYGEWTGYASATIIGVGRAARRTVDEVEATLRA